MWPPVRIMGSSENTEAPTRTLRKLVHKRRAEINAVDPSDGQLRCKSAWMLAHGAEWSTAEFSWRNRPTGLFAFQNGYKGCRDLILAHAALQVKTITNLLLEGPGSLNKVLNIGLGLGIIDSYFKSHDPEQHTIIEAHLTCLEHMRRTGWYDRRMCASWQGFLLPRGHALGPGALSVPRETIGVFVNEGHWGLHDFMRCAPRLLVGPNARLSFFHAEGQANMFSYENFTNPWSLSISG
ncbi:hypothetical protein WOLCODRAFT_141434 [Wolfiporia cocos MD-104 SS10]|uniref:Uncharacterized protein n=1 Tax=Wolfiporia cocos (strain MD-104) TaxID=742152 RepID=A0A2H3J2K0_WOLCO|nr:hypothetical protein WOLCODRAFT_141434 [Wolfiporia cocos MD-104 SS10]